MFKKILILSGAFLAPFLSSDNSKLILANASYYADKFNGRLTASGERYNPNFFTAAHRELPFNTLVRVTNPINQKSIVVRINDRGPFVKGRDIDLSKAAFQGLDILHKGLVSVELEVIGMSRNSQSSYSNKIYEVVKSESPTVPPKNTSASETSVQSLSNISSTINNGFTGNEKSEILDLAGKKVYPKGFGVQIGAFMNDENAIRYGEGAYRKGFENIYIQNLKTGKKNYNIYRVIVGEYKKEEEADLKIAELAKAGFSSAVIYTFQEE